MASAPASAGSQGERPSEGQGRTVDGDVRKLGHDEWRRRCNAACRERNHARHGGSGAEGLLAPTETGAGAAATAAARRLLLLTAASGSPAALFRARRSAAAVMARSVASCASSAVRYEHRAPHFVCRARAVPAPGWPCSLRSTCAPPRRRSGTLRGEGRRAFGRATHPSPRATRDPPTRPRAAHSGGTPLLASSAILPRSARGERGGCEPNARRAHARASAQPTSVAEDGED